MARRTNKTLKASEKVSPNPTDAENLIKTNQEKHQENDFRQLEKQNEILIEQNKQITESMKKKENEIKELKKKNQSLIEELREKEESFERLVQENQEWINQKIDEMLKSVNEIKEKLSKNSEVAKEIAKVMMPSKRPANEIEDKVNNCQQQKTQRIRTQRQKSKVNLSTSERKGKKPPKIRSSKIFQSLNEEQKKVVEYFFNNAERGTVAWTNESTSTQITDKILEDMFFDRFIDGQVIDWYSYQLERRVTIKSMFFKTVSWIAVRDNHTHMQKDLVEDPVKKALDDNVEYMLFPINSGRNAADKLGYHWHLLLLNMSSQQWIRYDSMKPGSGKRITNTGAADTEKLKDKVNQIIGKWAAENAQKSKWMNIDMEKLKGRVEFEECPQQGPTVHCAVFVCKFMEWISMGKDMPKEFQCQESEKCRALWAYQMLSDPPRTQELRAAIN